MRITQVFSNGRCLLAATLMLALGAAEAQIYPGQKPPPMRKRSVLDRIMGPAEPAVVLSREINVCIVWGYDNANHNPDKKNHATGAHEFRLFKDRMAGLLVKVPKVRVDSAFYFPTKAQWEKADFVFWHLQPDFFLDSHYVHMDRFQARGGGMAVIGEATILRPTGNAWANRMGLAWREGTSKWGPLPVPQQVNTALGHPLVKGFPDTLDFQDELYWDMVPGVEANLKVLVSSQAGAEGNVPPLSGDKMPARQWPVVWAYEKGAGKVLGTPLMHNSWTFNDPMFRILLFRALAWSLGESFAPFRSLVTDGIPVTEDVTVIRKRPVAVAPIQGPLFIGGMEGLPGIGPWRGRLFRADGVRVPLHLRQPRPRRPPAAL